MLPLRELLMIQQIKQNFLKNIKGEILNAQNQVFRKPKPVSSHDSVKC